MPRPGTIRILLFAALATVATRGTYAATKEPPYEAVVESDEAFARCGPGQNFYPTGKLKRGDHVTVRRHDPGGWFMIDPPPGSFSLIRGDEVLREGNVGTVKQLAEGQAPVRIGSAIDPTIDSIFQRQLSSGERVEILGEATIPRRDRQVQMFKIRPPKGEFRWIEGMNLTPLDQQIQEQQIRDQQARNRQTLQPVEPDPFAAPAQVRKNSSSNGRLTASGKPVAKLTTSRSVTPVPSQGALAGKGGPATGTPTTPLDPGSRLDQIDLLFRNTIQRQPATWNLAQIEQAYRELNQQSIPPSIRGQLELRFSALDHYKQVKAEYDDYFRLVSNTARKDAELAAIQNSLDPQDARPPIMPSGQAGPPTDPSLNTTPNAGNGRAAALPAMNVPNSQAPPNVPAQPATGPQSETRAVGPVLENPVPVPTEPQSESSARGTVRPESPAGSSAGSPAGSPPGIAPNDAGSFSQERPASPGALPMPSSSTGGPVDTGNRPTPLHDLGPGNAERRSNETQANEFQTPTPSTGGTLRNSTVVPQAPQPGTAPAIRPAPQVRQFPSTEAVPQLAAPRQIRPQGGAALDGAGIVQRAATMVPGGPRHVLLTPNGRILAYLYSDNGINLDAYLGRSMGIVGPRAYRPELQTDLIVVRGMMPVRLVP
jgi:uncharacterized protein YgiM (DUF1202 family)